MRLPGVTAIAKLISSIRERVEQRLYFKLYRLPNQEQIKELESLIVVTQTSRKTLLDQWRTSPTRISSAALVNALKKMENIRAVEIGELDISKIPSIRIKFLAKTAFTSKFKQLLGCQKLKELLL